VFKADILPRAAPGAHREYYQLSVRKHLLFVPEIPVPPRPWPEGPNPPSVDSNVAKVEDAPDTKRPFFM
jgi:hypothetical protein